jgi:hypothetical protein
MRYLPDLAERIRRYGFPSRALAMVSGRGSGKKREAGNRR